LFCALTAFAPLSSLLMKNHCQGLHHPLLLLHQFITKAFMVMPFHLSSS